MYRMEAGSEEVSRRRVCWSGVLEDPQRLTGRRTGRTVPAEGTNCVCKCLEERKNVCSGAVRPQGVVWPDLREQDRRGTGTAGAGLAPEGSRRPWRHFSRGR